MRCEPHGELFSLLVSVRRHAGTCPSRLISDGTDSVAPGASPSKPGVTLGTRPASFPQPPGDVISHCLLHPICPSKPRTCAWRSLPGGRGDSALISWARCPHWLEGHTRTHMHTPYTLTHITYVHTRVCTHHTHTPHLHSHAHITPPTNTHACTHTQGGLEGEACPWASWAACRAGLLLCRQQGHRRFRSPRLEVVSSDNPSCRGRPSGWQAQGQGSAGGCRGSWALGACEDGGCGSSGDRRVSGSEDREGDGGWLAGATRWAAGQCRELQR